MRVAAFWMFLALAASAAAQTPLAIFDGVIHGASRKQITIENSDGNLIDFEINGKTRVMRDEKRISAQDLKTGDQVAIEARQEMVQYLVAVTITAREKAKEH